MEALLIEAARVEDRNQDIGRHVAGEQDASVREEDRGVAWRGTPPVQYGPGHDRG